VLHLDPGSDGGAKLENLRGDTCRWGCIPALQLRCNSDAGIERTPLRTLGRFGLKSMKGSKDIGRTLHAD